MPTRVSRLSLKLMLVTLAALVLLAATIVPLVANRFRHTQREVTRRSTAGLAAQGSDALQRLTDREIMITAAQLQRGAITSRQAGDYLAEAIRLETAPAAAPQLARGTQGQYFDPSPARRSDVFVPNTVAALTPDLARDLRESAALDPLFPTLLANYPDAVAVSYLSPLGLVRAYPITDLAQVVPPGYAATADPSFVGAAPPANPARATVWRAPFSDPAGQGLLVTASTPVYVGDEFRGVVVVNISLRSLIDHLYAQKPTLNGYAFLIDGEGHLIAAPPAALVALVGPGQGGANPSLRSTLGLPLVAGDADVQRAFGAMRQGQQGLDRVTLGGQPVLLAYGPLANVGWRLGLVAPLGEITAESAALDRAIVADADATLASTLALMAVVFLLTLLGTAALGRQVLTRPIAALVAGTRAISSGHFDVKIPDDRRDELGDLAASFNRMTGEIATARDGLERRTAELTATNAALEVEVAERRRAEEALQEREAQYRSIFEETGDGIVITEPGGRIVEVNPAMCQLHGYTRDELLALAPVQLVRPEDRQIVPDALAAVREHGQFQARAVAVRKDGGQFHVEIHGAGFLFKGRPHILSVIRDVSERMAAYELLETRVAERTRELTALLRIAHDVASTLELGPLLGLILDRLGTVVGYSAASISTIDGPELVQVEYRGPQPPVEIVPRRVPLAAAEELWARLDRREVIAIDDVQAGGPLVEAYGRLFPGGHLEARDEVRAWLGVPLLTQDRPIGLLVIASATPGDYTAAHRRVVAAVAAQAAVAIENARLYERAGALAALEERQRLARELHDSVSQALYGIALGSRTARALLDRDPTKLAGPLDYILQLAEAGLTEMRALIFELRPESLATEGLVAALNKQAAALSARHGLAVEADLGAEPDLPLETKEALYRIAQEALHNIVKHARARHAELRLRCDGDTCALEIGDDGIGFDTGGTFPGHLGLRSMHERAARLGGTLAIESTPGAGTRLAARVPLQGQPLPAAD